MTDLTKLGLLKSGNDLYGVASGTLDAVKKIYTTTQHLRFHMFLRACRAELEQQGKLSAHDEQAIVAWFDSDFGREQAYEFIRRAIEAGSEIARLAMGRLYVRCAAKANPGISSDELATLSAYEELDDATVRLVLYLEKCFPSASHTPDNRRQPYGVLEVPRDEISNRREELLQRFGVESAEDLEDRLDTLGRLAMYRASRGFVSSSSMSIVRNKHTKAFLEDLRWAMSLLDPSSDLIQR